MFGPPLMIVWDGNLERAVARKLPVGTVKARIWKNGDFIRAIQVQ